MAIFAAAVERAQVFISARGTRYSYTDILQTQAERCFSSFLGNGNLLLPCAIFRLQHLYRVILCLIFVFFHAYYYYYYYYYYCTVFLLFFICGADL